MPSEDCKPLTDCRLQTDCGGRGVRACDARKPGELVIVRRFANLAKKLVPDPLFGWLRRFGTALLTPISFSYQTGHFKSSLGRAPMDRHGNPIPWYTYPAIHFLQSKDLCDKRVLEFGAGYSTLWWAKYAGSVIAFEDNPEWYEQLQPKVPTNVSLHYVGNGEPLPDCAALSGQTFDIIVIDGLKREYCAQLAPKLLAPDGALVIDNAEGYGSSGYRSIVEPFCQQGFRRVDFYGYAPGVSQPHCTSIVFGKSTFLFASSRGPRVPFLE